MKVTTDALGSIAMLLVAVVFILVVIPREGFFGDGRTGNVPLTVPMDKYTQDALRRKDQEIYANLFLNGRNQFIDNLGEVNVNCHAYTYPQVHDNVSNRYSNSFQTNTWPRWRNESNPQPSEDITDERFNEVTLYTL